MGFAGISMPQLLLVLAIVLLIFGTKRIRQAGGDLGGMIRGFKDEMKDAPDSEYGILDAAKDVRKVKKTADKVRKIM